MWPRTHRRQDTRRNPWQSVKSAAASICCAALSIQADLRHVTLEAGQSVKLFQSALDVKEGPHGVDWGPSVLFQFVSPAAICNSHVHKAWLLTVIDSNIQLCMGGAVPLVPAQHSAACRNDLLFGSVTLRTSEDSKPQIMWATWRVQVQIW